MVSFRGAFSSLFDGSGRKPASRRVYLDNASVTPVDPRVLREMTAVAAEYPANPSSLYAEGVAASKKLEEARARVALCLEAHADEIVFTSGGTESNNLAILGVLESADTKALLGDKKPHIVTTSFEHPSIRELAFDLEKRGKCTVAYLEVGEAGVVDPREIKKALTPETVLVSVMYVNNEIGTIQPIQEIAKTVRHFKKELARTGSAGQYPIIHTDASQAALYCSLRTPALGVDLITLDGSKIYGPRSFGILFKRRPLKLAPIMKGGSQENDMRPGTENVAGASGFALALEIGHKEQENELIRVGGLRNRLLKEIQKEIPEIQVNGSTKEEERLPNNINVCLPGMDAEFAVLKLDVRGVSASSVTSCRAKNEDSSSYVVEALGKSDCAKSSLRFTLGRFTTVSDVSYAAKKIVEVLRSFR